MGLRPARDVPENDRTDAYRGDGDYARAARKRPHSSGCRVDFDTSTHVGRSKQRQNQLPDSPQLTAGEWVRVNWPNAPPQIRVPYRHTFRHKTSTRAEYDVRPDVPGSRGVCCSPVRLEFVVRPPLEAGPTPYSGRPNAHCSVAHARPYVRRRRSTAGGPPTRRGCVPRCRRPNAAGHVDRETLAGPFVDDGWPAASAPASRVHAAPST